MKPLNLALLVLLALLAVSGCASQGSSAVPVARQVSLTVAPETGLRTALALLVERGYVIRHADAALGRADAELARWPGYRVSVRVSPAGDGGSRVALSASRDGRPLPPALLDPLLEALTARPAGH